MYFKPISEKNSIEFVKNLLDYYSEIDNGSINTILTSKDIESKRNNVGWYQYVDKQHKTFINVPNMMYLKRAVDGDEVSQEAFYAFLTLCTGHEHRHFQQGRCIYDGIEIDGYGQKDVLAAQLMLYIRYFFDGYYLVNKGYVKYEEDAEKFAIEKGLEFLKNNFKDIDAEKAMTEAVTYYAYLQSRSGFMPTLPTHCKNIDEIIAEINNKINKNSRINNLTESLFVYSPRFYQNHGYFGLDEEKLLTEALIKEYSELNNGYEQDTLVAKTILSMLDSPIESLEEFPKLKKYYLEKKI